MRERPPTTDSKCEDCPYIMSTSYKIYHNTFTSAVDAALELAASCGFAYDYDDYFSRVTTGPGKPAEDETFSTTLNLHKDGKEVKDMLVFQVYGLRTQYELNAYIS